MATKLKEREEQKFAMEGPVTTGKSLLELLQKENFFDGNTLQSQLGDQGVQMTKEEEKMLGAHLEDRRKLADADKRIKDTASENIVKTSARVKALGHMQVGKEQVKNYLDHIENGLKFDQMMRTKFAEKNETMKALITLSDNLDAELGRLFATAGMTEATRISLYNRLQQTKMYVDAHMKEYGRGLYVQHVLAPELRKKMQDEDMIRELVGLAEVENYQQEFALGQKDGTAIDIFRADYTSLKAEMDQAIATEANEEEVQDTLQETQKEGKKIYTRKEAMDYQTKKVEQEIADYKFAVEHLSEMRKQAERFRKQKEESTSGLSDKEREAKERLLNYYGTLMKAHGASNDAWIEVRERLCKFIADNDVFFAKYQLESYIKEHPQLPKLTQDQTDDLVRAKSYYELAMQAYMTAFHTMEESKRNAANLEARIKEVEENGKRPLIHPSVKQDVIRARAERMLVRQHRPDTIRQIEDKVELAQRGKRYAIRGKMTNNYKQDMAVIMQKIKEKEKKKAPTLAEIEYQVEELFKMLFDKGSLCMCVPKNVDDILAGASNVQTDGRFKNSLETAFRGESYNNSRKDFTDIKYGTEFVTSIRDYEKYGYLDDAKGLLRNDSIAGAFGEVRYVLKKSKMKHRTTYTYEDSMGYSESSQPSLLRKPSLVSVPASSREDVIKLAREYHRYKSATPEQRKKMTNFEKMTMEEFLTKCRVINTYNTKEMRRGNYLELQYHGELTTNDIAEVNYYVCYPNHKGMEERDGYKDVVSFIKGKRAAIEAWKAKGVKVNLMLRHYKKHTNKRISRERSQFDLTKVNLDELLAIQTDKGVDELNLLAAEKMEKYRERGERVK